MASKATKETESRMDPTFLPWKLDRWGAIHQDGKSRKSNRFKNGVERRFHLYWIKVLL